jgi:YesN/AraC family two-component response regulator
MTKQTILIVEDELLVGLALKIELRKAGYRICGMVTSGEDALEAVRNELPDVVIMDIRLLGKMDGIEAASQIRSFSSSKIIFTTGYQDPELKKRASLLNPIAYLIKPVNWHDVDAILCSL